MNKLSLSDFRKLFKINLGKRHIDECAALTANKDCVFDEGVVLPNSQVSNLYSLRLEIAKENDRISGDYINDFENIVASLKKSTSEFVGIANLFNERNVYMILYEADNKRILGAIKAKINNNNLVEKRLCKDHGFA